jgi:molybdate transport system regulatory protein
MRKQKRKRSLSSPHFRPKEKEKSPADVGTNVMKKYRLNARLWINKGEETFLAVGRVTLLERIKEYGSITQAARSMGMSYRHAWELVDSMNRLAPKPLVVTETGGKGGGGTALTPAGEKLVARFWKMFQELKEFMKEKQKKWESLS